MMRNDSTSPNHRHGGGNPPARVQAQRPCPADGHRGEGAPTARLNQPAQADAVGVAAGTRVCNACRLRAGRLARAAAAANEACPADGHRGGGAPTMRLMQPAQADAVGVAVGTRVCNACSLRAGRLARAAEAAAGNEACPADGHRGEGAPTARLIQPAQADAVGVAAGTRVCNACSVRAGHLERAAQGVPCSAANCDRIAVTQLRPDAARDLGGRDVCKRCYDAVMRRGQCAQGECQERADAVVSDSWPAPGVHLAAAAGRGVMLAGHNGPVVPLCSTHFLAARVAAGQPDVLSEAAAEDLVAEWAHEDVIELGAERVSFATLVARGHLVSVGSTQQTTHSGARKEELQAFLQKPYSVAPKHVLSADLGGDGRYTNVVPMRQKHAHRYLAVHRVYSSPITSNMTAVEWALQRYADDDLHVQQSQKGWTVTGGGNSGKDGRTDGQPGHVFCVFSLVPHSEGPFMYLDRKTWVLGGASSAGSGRGPLDAFFPPKPKNARHGR